LIWGTNKGHKLLKLFGSGCSDSINFVCGTLGGSG